MEAEVVISEVLLEAPDKSIFPTAVELEKRSLEAWLLVGGADDPLAPKDVSTSDVAVSPQTLNA